MDAKKNQLNSEYEIKPLGVDNFESLYFFENLMSNKGVTL